MTNELTIIPRTIGMVTRMLDAIGVEDAVIVSEEQKEHPNFIESNTSGITLEELEKSNKSLYYFDTTSEGEELYKYRQFYNSLGVQSVPTIIVIKSGSIEKNIDLIKNPEKIPTILNEEF